MQISKGLREGGRGWSDTPRVSLVAVTNCNNCRNGMFYFLSIIITGTLSGPISSKGCKLQATHPRVDNVFDQEGVA